MVAVNDGAAWCQGGVDLHRPDAVRVLDFAHALAHLGQVAQARFGPGTEAASAWLGQQAHALRHGREAAVLAELHTHQQVPDVDAAPRNLLAQTHAYLAHRRGQIRYQTVVAAGDPIGSGCGESANTLLLEARLTGAGMHWARDHVTPMLALRTLLANDRWHEPWPAIWERLRHPPREPAPPPDSAPAPDRLALPPAAAAVTGPEPAARAKTIIDGTPTAQHPWRRASPVRAKR